MARLFVDIDHVIYMEIIGIDLRSPAGAAVPLLIAALMPASASGL